MLCRTASDLYWVSRNMERAENTARLVDLALRIAMLPDRYDRGKSEAAPWRRALEALGTGGHYTATYGTIEPEGVLRHLLLSAENPSSIHNCLRAARENARAQRGAITAEMYEDLNASWLEIRSHTWAGVRSNGISNIVEWVKSRSASFRGVTIGTLGRGEAYQFLQLGAFIERADWAIRLLDVVGSDGEIDESGEARDATEYFQWSALLQSQSAFEIYRRLYRESVTPRSVTDLMLLRDVNPRSLQTCLNSLHKVLRAMTGGESHEVVRVAGALSAQTRYARIDDIIARGLEPHLQATLASLDELGEATHAQFMVSLDAGHGQSQTQG